MNTLAETPTTAWVTKHALAEGVKRVEGVVVKGTSGDYLRVGAAFDTKAGMYYGKDWHLDEASAAKRAVEMIDAKLKAIDRQRERLLHLRKRYA